MSEKGEIAQRRAGQTVLPYSQPTEAEKRDTILDIFEDTRGDLVDIARKIACDIVRKRGRVTSTEVLSVMRLREDTRGRLIYVDKRFMGAVFRRKNGWKHLGYELTGSHCRPVSVWGR